MCGIFGIVAGSARQGGPLRADVARGLDCIRHRGPDGQGVWVSPDGAVGFGHARLASTARYTQVATKTISKTPSPLDRLRLEVVPPG